MIETWRRPLAFWAAAVVGVGAVALALVDRPAPALAVAMADETGGESSLSPGATPTTVPSTTVPEVPTTTVDVPPADATAPAPTEGSLPRATGGPGDPNLELPAYCVPGTDDGQGGCRHKPETVTGVVTDTAGRPLAGICVYTADPRSPVAATTGADGRYTVVEPPHSFDIVNRYEDCTDDPFGWMPVYAPIRQGQHPGETTELAPIVMTRYAGIDGLIVDANGTPVAGACFGDVRTGVDGRFRTGGIEPGERALTAYGTDCPIQYMSIPRETYRFESGQWTDVTITVVLVGQVPPPGWLPPAG